MKTGRMAMGRSGGIGHFPPNTMDMIEVQSGTYVGEDDIIRLSNVYNWLRGKGSCLDGGRSFGGDSGYC